MGMWVEGESNPHGLPHPANAMWARRDLNPHGLLHWILSPTRLPVPPRALVILIAVALAGRVCQFRHLPIVPGVSSQKKKSSNGTFEDSYTLKIRHVLLKSKELTFPFVEAH